MDRPMPAVLSIAGSDSGGGAGAQADLRTFARLGVWGTTAITAVTAQDLDGVRHVEAMTPSVVVAQARAAVEGFGVSAVKTGMLASADVVRAVAQWLEEAGIGQVVVDPVMVASSGRRLLPTDAVDVYREALIPRCMVLTPNLDEASVLLDAAVEGEEALDDAAATLSRRFGCSVLLKGGHLDGDPIDVLYEVTGETRHFRRPRRKGLNTHGTGCVLSAAIAAHLATGRDLIRACELAIDFVSDSLSTPHRLASGVEVMGIERAGVPGRRP